MALKKLGVIKNIVEFVGMGVGHAYDDLVFLDHNAFLLQFTSEEDTVIIHSNCEADKAALKDAVAMLQGAAKAHEMTFIEGSDYSLSQTDDENLRVEFMAEEL